MLDFYYKTKKDNALNKIKDFKAGSWVNVSDPSEQDFDFLEKKLNLDKTLLSDALDQYEMPRMEKDDDNGNVYIFTRYALGHHGENTTSPILVVLGENFILTFAKESPDFLENFINKNIVVDTSQKFKCLIQFFSAINANYLSSLNLIRKNISKGKVSLDRVRERDIIKFLSFENVLNDYLSALVPANAIFNNLLSGKVFRFYEEDEELIEDLRLSNSQLIELSTSSMKVIVNIREAYSVIITNELNRVIKLLTSVTVLLTVPTMISSFYGMNVELPLQNYPHISELIITTTLGSVITLLIVFIKKRWI